MSQPGEPFLTRSEEQLLLQIARDSLTCYVTEGGRLELAPYPLTPATREHHGAFVTLRSDGVLRGCIGYTKALEPLAETVRDNAINAAARDPRFPPVSPTELEGLSIEVSALCPGEEPDSPFIVVKDVNDIEIGHDGLYLENAGPRGGGLLLPQVPVEQGWSLEQYLQGICRKAGARFEAWEDEGVTLYRFRAQVFHEG
jgi:AmmeMemoRadiSam system protein A